MAPFFCKLLGIGCPPPETLSCGPGTKKEGDMCVAALEFGPATQASVDNPNRCEVKYGDERVIDMRNLCDWHTVGRNCGASVSGTGSK